MIPFVSEMYTCLYYYGDVTTICERLQISTVARRSYVIHTSCQVFGSGTVSTCCNGLGLSRPGFEHPAFRMRSERSPKSAIVTTKQY